MIQQAIDRILELNRPERVMIEGRNYTPLDLSPVEPPSPKSHTVHTLGGLADYIRSNVDDLDYLNLIVHVASHDCVQVFSGLNEEWRKREFYLQASLLPVVFDFDRWLDQESFVIGMMAKFRPENDRDDILQVVGNLVENTQVKIEDDGMTQQVSAKAGIGRIVDVSIENPVTLTPYRTFIEVEQPASKFVLRMRKGGEGKAPQIALFEADGGAWRIEAINNVARWLKAELPEDVTVIS